MFCPFRKKRAALFIDTLFNRNSRSVNFYCFAPRNVELNQANVEGTTDKVQCGTSTDYK